MQAGRLVGSEVKRLKLKLSTKSTVAPLNSVTVAVAKQLSDEGITLQVAKKHDDVGLEMSAASTRAAGTLNSRIHDKGAPRANRVHSLGKINNDADKLIMTGVHPAQSYGYQGMGASVSQQMSMRKNVKNGTQFAGTTACTTCMEIRGKRRPTCELPYWPS